MPDAVLRRMRADDVEALVRLTAATGLSRSDEVEMARDVLTDQATRGDASGYRTFVAVEDQSVVGYVTFGQTPLTRGTWEVHWLAVDPRVDVLDTGALLTARVAEEACREKARQILVEMSGAALYEQMRQIYVRQGFRQVSSIPDFYDAGEPRVTFAMTLDCGKTQR